MVNKLNL